MLLIKSSSFPGAAQTRSIGIIALICAVILSASLSLAAPSARNRGQFHGAGKESRHQLSGSRYNANVGESNADENSNYYSQDESAPSQERSAAASAASNDGPDVGTDEASAVDPEFNDLTGDSSDKMDEQMDGAANANARSGNDDADEADDDGEGTSAANEQENGNTLPASTGKFQRAQSQYFQSKQQPQASSTIDRLMGNPGNFAAMNDDEDSNIGLGSSISNSKVRMSTTDLETAAGHHHGHKHYPHGWLKMGAHTGKKGSFGWHDKHPVGGKGRR